MAAILFYDGSCALCHGFVRWVLARDASGEFHFAPLGGATFRQLVLEAQQRGLPNSVVVRDESGALHSRSAAVILVLSKLGRRRLARALELLPRPLRDLGYAAVARIRYAIFGRKQEWCPLVPPELRARFLE
jgi:predicted DCC family thiol-disulfide oxidoreductase YuxK